MDQLIPFRTSRAGTGEVGEVEAVVNFNPRTGNPAILELHPVEATDPDCTVYLFRGSLNEDECRQAITGQNSNSQPDFLLAANLKSPSFIKFEPNGGEYTLYTESGVAWGFVRIVECECSSH